MSWFFINDAVAATASAQQGGGNNMISFLFLAAFVVVFYLMLLRPQQKRAKEQKNLMGNLSKGDEVITNGGILGKITKINDEFVSLSVAEGIEIKLQKSAIVASVPKGTMKTV